jgi:hypothetical protein
MCSCICKMKIEPALFRLQRRPLAAISTPLRYRGRRGWWARGGVGTGDGDDARAPLQAPASCSSSLELPLRWTPSSSGEGSWPWTLLISRRRVRAARRAQPRRLGSAASIPCTPLSILQGACGGAAALLLPGGNQMPGMMGASFAQHLWSSCCFATKVPSLSFADQLYLQMQMQNSAGVSLRITTRFSKHNFDFLFSYVYFYESNW